MAKVRHAVSRSAQTLPAGATRYFPLGMGGFSPFTTESTVKDRVREAGTHSLLYVRITANATTATSTLRTRKNGANGNMSVSISSGATGEFEDTTNSDTLSAGDDWNGQVVIGTGGTLTLVTVGTVFDPSSSTVTRYQSSDVANFSTASTTRYRGLGQASGNSSTESDAQTEFDVAGTLQNMALVISSNARSTDTIFGTRINGADGALIITVSGGSTGLFEDTTHTDTVVANDLVNLYWTTSTGTGGITVGNWGVSFVNGSSLSQVVAAVSPAAGETIAANVTRYLSVFGLATAFTTESDATVDCNVQFVASNFKVHITTNGVTATTTLKLRKNGADGANVISVSSGATGHFEDTTHTDAFDVGDEIGASIVTGATGTSLVFRSTSFKMNMVAADPPDGDPTNLTATAISATKVDLAWDRGSTNNTGVRIQQAPDNAGSPGTWADITTVGAATEAYTVENLSPTTKYHWRVIETNADGDSDPSNSDDATTLTRPTVFRVVPSGASVPLPTGLGIVIDFEVDADDAEDGPLSGASIVWVDSVEGSMGTGAVLQIDIDTDLPTLGAHTLTVTVTDSDGDTATTGWNINITEVGGGVGRLKREPMADIPVPYGVGFIERSLHFEDPSNGAYVEPTFVAGDVTIRIDNGTRVNTTNLPAQVASTLDYDFELEGAEVEGQKIVVDIIDQSDPKVWVDIQLIYRTYGSSLAFYPEPVQELGSDNKALISDDVVVGEPAIVPAWGASFTTMFGWVSAFFKNKRINDGDVEALRNEADDADIGVADITSGGGSVTKDAWT